MHVNGTSPPVPSIDLPHDKASVSIARRWAANVLNGVINEDAVYDITVCVSELVTNSLLHTAPTTDRKDITCKIHVRPLTSGTLIHVECIDPGSRSHAPTDRSASDTDEHGRGLRVVKGIADEWGYDNIVSGQATTWFIIVVDRPPDPPAPH